MQCEKMFSQIIKLGNQHKLFKATKEKKEIITGVENEQVIGIVILAPTS